MKVLHCTTYTKGGAGIAAHHLHTALKQSGVESLMGVRKKTSDDVCVVELASPLDVFFTRCSNLPLHFLRNDTPNFYSCYALPNSIAQRIQKIQPDIIHLHWIANFISPRALRDIIKLGIPVLWTLHDTWAFTGGCHYGTCLQWQQQCQKCPLFTHPQGFMGLNVAHVHWKAKRRAYAVKSPHIVAPSQKLWQKVQQSSLLQHAASSCIPNAVDTNIFSPMSQQEARWQLGIEEDVSYILFGAMAATSDHNKGYDLLKEALTHLPQQNNKNVQCLIFGAAEGEKLPLPSTFLGRIDTPEKLALAYAAANVFVCPSREEAFSLTTLEALACGTPAVGFAIGGIPDMVQHKENGYIAKPYDTQDFANGIAYILEDAARHHHMSQCARKTAEQRYAYPVIAKQYITLYEKLLATK